MSSTIASSDASAPSSPETSDLPQQNESANNQNQEKVSKHRPSYFTPKIKFSPHEDMLLLHAVQSLGTGDWHIIASRVPGRNARQCRERWNNYVNPALISAPWTAEEDCFLMEKYQELGPRWRTIASYFASRSTNSIKNRFTILQRRQKKKNSKKSKEKQSAQKSSSSNFNSQQVSSCSSSSSSLMTPSINNNIPNSFFFSKNNNSALSSTTSSPPDPNMNKTTYDDFIIIDELGTNKTEDENKSQNQDPLHFLDNLKEIDSIFWENGFDDYSLGLFDTYYF
ncbi:hypothetical protein M9Y10_038084 [Tritrichomonas musculus]|uniref:Myb-like DNA-binding domain containing protein n=1 Tax=Tritrichomonas musculus TaxID=1915356 RepID=A0ABR2K7E6_9EUKA